MVDCMGSNPSEVHNTILKVKSQLFEYANEKLNSTPFAYSFPLKGKSIIQKEYIVSVSHQEQKIILHKQIWVAI